MARSRSSMRSPASSPSPRRSGARPTATACLASPSSTRWIASEPTSTARCTRSARAWGRAPCPSSCATARRPTSGATSTCSARKPSPADVPAVEGKDPKTGALEVREHDDNEPFSALAFKIQMDPQGVGKLTFFRVYSGRLKAGSSVMNASTGKRERIGRILRMHAIRREDVDEIFTGDIAAAVGLKSTTTGDTLCDEAHPILLESITFPEPVISVAIEPKTKADQEKLGMALQRLSEEDPTFKVHTDEETGQTIIEGMGELHLELIIDRLLREFRVDANQGKPQVAYKEAIRRPAHGG